MRGVIAFNPQAGPIARVPVADAQQILREAGWRIDIEETRAPGDGWRVAQEAAARGAEIVFAAGGDGTMNEVANGLYGTDTALGILPIGTANVWAKEMGLRAGDVRHAARAQVNGELRWIDVGRVTAQNMPPRIFVLWCGAGFDAHISAEVARQPGPKRRLGALFFWMVGAQAALEFRGRPAVLRIDGRVTRGRYMLALASNAQLYGGVVRIAPVACVDDGWLDLTLFQGSGPFLTTWHLVRVFLRLHLAVPDIEHIRAREIEIRAKRLPVHVDGETIGWTPVHIRLEPKRLRVLVPPNANPTLFSARPSHMHEQPRIPAL